MKRNLLFINVLLFFTCAFVAFLVYAANNYIDDLPLLYILDILLDNGKIFVYQALIILVLAIPLGRLPKKPNSKVDCVMIECLLFIISTAAVVILKNSDETFINYYYNFIGWGVATYLGFLGVVCLLKYMTTLLFKRDLSVEHNPTIVSRLSLLATLILVVGGFLGVGLRSLYLEKIGVYPVFSDYYYQASMTQYIVLISYGVVVVALHAIASIKTKTAKAPLVVFLLAFATAIVCQLLLVHLDVLPNYKNQMYEMVFAVFIGGYGLLLFVSALCYILRPFTKYIFNFKNSIEEKREYATVEDFVLLTEALVESNKRKTVVKEVARDTLKDESREEVAEVKPKKKEEVSDEIVDTPHYETELVTTITKGFKAKLINAPDEIKNLYDDLLNIVNQYKKCRARHAFAKDTIVHGRNKIAVIKMSPSSKRMYIFFNLNKDEYLAKTKYHLKDFSEKRSYEATPLRLSVKSERSMKYAKELLEAALLLNDAEAYKLEKEHVDYLAELEPQTEEQMIENGLIKKKVVEETYLVEPIYEEEKESVEENAEDTDTLDTQDSKSLVEEEFNLLDEDDEEEDEE